jgi:hypothetical protein
MKGNELKVFNSHCWLRVFQKPRVSGWKELTNVSKYGGRAPTSAHHLLGMNKLDTIL